MLIWISLLSICIGLTASMEGESNNKDWAYQWYSGESFRFQCHISGLNISQTDSVVWEKSDKNVSNDTEYEITSKDNVEGSQLLIKKVNPNVHGVYICKVLDSNDVIRGHTIYGLNIHEVKYHDMLDKYKRHINVAFIAAAIFLGLVLSICLVHRFQYVTPEMKAKREQRKGGKLYYEGNEMQTATNGRLADSVASPEGKGAYENPEVFTQL